MGKSIYNIQNEYPINYDKLIVINLNFFILKKYFQNYIHFFD